MGPITIVISIFESPFMKGVTYCAIELRSFKASTITSDENQDFWEVYRNTENPPPEMEMKAFLIEQKKTSLEELILKANNDKETPDE